MSDDAQGTINNAEVPSTPGMATSGDLVSTVEQKIPAGATPATEAKSEEELAADKAKEEESRKAEEERLDKHPRFQQLITQNRELRESMAEMKGKLDALSTNKGPQGSETTTDEGRFEFQDIVQMGNDKIIDAMAEDPLAFLSNFAKQIHAESLSIVEGLIEKAVDARLQGYEGKKQEEVFQGKIADTYNSFAEKHADFVELWEAGKIQEIMESNPGHNAISAYWELVGSDEFFSKRVDDAVKAKERGLLTSLKAKGHNRTLGAGPAGPSRGDGIPAELKDSKKYGGDTAVLAARHAARRAAAS